jgi:hypothetical protein
MMKLWPFTRKSDKPPAKQTHHHYVLAHIALRQVALSDPYLFFAVMASPQQQEFLANLWKQVCHNCDKEGAAFFDCRDLIIHTTRIGDYPAVLIEMPKAYFVAEAHMVCAVLKVSIEELAQKPDRPEVRYFTLEKGMNMPTGADRTVLCSWKGDTHANFGDGPEANAAAFMERIKQMI